LKKPTGPELPFENLQESWEEFCADVLFDTSEAEQENARKAFFAGATTTWLLFFKALRMRNKSESNACIDALFRELDEFVINDVFRNMVVPEGNA
jgi:hypothetical protein